MKIISIEKMALIRGGVTARQCFFAGVGIVFTTSILGYCMGWFQSNMNTIQECIE